MQHVYKSAANKDAKENETGEGVTKTARWGCEADGRQQNQEKRVHGVAPRAVEAVTNIVVLLP